MCSQRLMKTILSLKVNAKADVMDSCVCIFKTKTHTKSSRLAEVHLIYKLNHKQKTLTCLLFNGSTSVATEKAVVTMAERQFLLDALL